MATDSEGVKIDAKLERANRVRAELGLRPLTAQQVAHDRSLADARGLRLWCLVDACTTMRLDGSRFD